MRKAVVERDQVAEAVAGFELALLHQLVGYGDAVDALAALVEFGHALEDAAMFLQAEVGGLDEARHLHEGGIVEKDRAEDEPLGVKVDRQPFFESNVLSGHPERPDCNPTPPALGMFSPRLCLRSFTLSVKLWKTVLRPQGSNPHRISCFPWPAQEYPQTELLLNVCTKNKTPQDAG